MTPKEIIGQLRLLRVEITDRTLYNYSEWKLIPAPERGSGRSGKWVEYPGEAMAEAYAAWKLLHGEYWSEEACSGLGLNPPKLSPEMVSTIRRLKKEIDTQDWEQFKREPTNFEEAVKFILAANKIFDAHTTFLMAGYIKLWERLILEARGIIADILNDPEY